jgi:hypothetical protein
MANFKTMPYFDNPGTSVRNAVTNCTALESRTKNVEWIYMLQNVCKYACVEVLL